ncbi:hypothetical protein CL689_02450 [Candidatus Saccharibacteria bacterium]|nr:hypothetical protein [Candidatus Saccharibacteria bacterium]|tara:strand:- start:2472 stop:2657 length:186 start_codon:yes stop_codon:yes gene_type:complete
MFFTPTEAKIGYQEVSHLFASLLSHGGNRPQQHKDMIEEQTKTVESKRSGAEDIESFLMGG